jgi:hypothetical protein
LNKAKVILGTRETVFGLLFVILSQGFVNYYKSIQHKGNPEKLVKLNIKPTWILIVTTNSPREEGCELE